MADISITCKRSDLENLLDQRIKEIEAAANRTEKTEARIKRMAVLYSMYILKNEFDKHPVIKTRCIGYALKARDAFLEKAQAVWDKLYPGAVNLIHLDEDSKA